MSLVAISGNASGTGTLTIAAPNTNSNRTLTLPDGTGTFNISGVVNEVPAGTVSAPSIYSTGDTNTGIFFPAADTIAFAEGGAEAMRIDSSGNLLVGITSGGGERLYVTQSAVSSTAFFLNNNGTATNQYGIVVKLNGDPNNGNHMVQCVGNATTRAEIRANGGLANYSANNVNLSDRREKTNFLPSKSYLDVICAIPVQTFNYIDQNIEEDDGLTLGVVAQDVQAVAPELVSESDWSLEKDGSKMRLSIYQTDLQYALMKCIQEQQAIITQLQADVAALKGTTP